MSDPLNLGAFDVKVTVSFTIDFDESLTFTIEQHAIAKRLQDALNLTAQQYQDHASRALAKFFQERGAQLLADDEISQFHRHVLGTKGV